MNKGWLELESDPGKLCFKLIDSQHIFMSSTLKTWPLRMSTLIDMKMQFFFKTIDHTRV